MSSTRGTAELDRSASVQVLSPEVALSRDADALIREARRRQWRRYLTTILALMSAAGLAAGLALAAGVSRGGHLPPGSHSRRSPGIRAAVHAVTAAPVPRSLRTTLLMWAWSLGPPVLDNLAARRTQQGNVLDISVGDYQYPIMHSGRWLVWIGNGATAIRDDLSGRPRILASTPDVAPAAQPGYIWLENGPANNPPQPRPIRLASIATGRTGPPIELPSGLALIAGTHAGLLVVDNQGRFEIWLPGSLPRPVPFAGSYQDGFGFSASVVSYGTGCRWVNPRGKSLGNSSYQVCLMLRVLNVVTGHLSSYQAPPGTIGWVPYDTNMISVAPGSTMIAAEAAIPSGLSDSGRLYVVPLRSARLVPVPGSAGLLLSKWAWSAHGDWLLYSGPGQKLWAFQESTGRVRESSTPCCNYGVMFAFPSPKQPSHR